MRWYQTFLLPCLLVVAACNQSTGPVTTSPKPSAEGAAYRLASEPSEAQGVIEAKAATKDDDEVTLVGRIGGDTKPFVQGQSAFTIVDSSLKPCNEKDDDACKTPWDYCCDTDELPGAKAIVKIVGPDGKPLAKDARTLLGLKELQTVVVRGKAKRDEAGNLTVLAEGVYVRNQ